MSLARLAVAAAERAPLPDVLTRAGVALMVDRARRRLAVAEPEAERLFARQMATRPIAENTAEANAQHYEVPAAFFRQVLGPRLKYSSCLFETAQASHSKK